MTVHVEEPRTARAIRPALVLNADYRPLSYAPLSLWCWQDAVKAVFRDRAVVVETYGETIRSPTFEMALPAVIALREFHRTPHFAALTRANMMLRDRRACLYCGSKSDLTFDHLVPRCLGGKTDWTNVLVACSTCNNRKSAKTPEQAGLTLPYKPYRPTSYQLMEIAREFPQDDIAEEYLSYIYWNVPLQR